MKDRRNIIIACLAVGLLVLLGTGIARVNSAGSRLERAEALHSLLADESGELARMRASVGYMKMRMKSSRETGVHAVVDRTIGDLGLSTKLTSTTSVTGGLASEEERAEARLEGLTLNESVNLLYTLENSRLPVVVRKVNLRKSFENPELLNLTITLSFLKTE